MELSIYYFSSESFITEVLKLIMKIKSANHMMQFVCKNTNQMKLFDDLMWTRMQFFPHCTEEDGCFESQPLLIMTNPNAKLNNSTVAIFTNSNKILTSDLHHFNKVILLRVIATKHDDVTEFLDIDEIYDEQDCATLCEVGLMFQKLNSSVYFVKKSEREWHKEQLA